MGTTHLNVLHVTPTIFGNGGVFGGGERYVENVVGAISAAAGDDVTQAIATMGKGPSSKADRNGHALYLCETDSVAPNPLDYFSGSLWPIVERFDLIHVHQPFTECGRATLIVAAQLGKTIVATDLGGGFLSGSALDHPISLAHRIIAISRFAAGFVTTLKTPTDVVIGPVDDRFFNAPLNSEDRSGVIYVGRFLPHKGVDRILAQAPSSLPIKIAGSVYDQVYYEYLLKLAKGKNVEFYLSPSDELLMQFYSTASACIVPSVVKDYRGHIHLNSELMGITTIEALASGTPVAVARTASLPELVADCSAARIFESDIELRCVLDDIAAGRWPLPGNEHAIRSYAKQRASAKVVGVAILESYRLAIAASGGK
jgi:glycosyltransferase involved in cell wall biosynthesis